ncbi:MAG: DUF4012 domain-containing protein [Candidatus Komeilibacteria bacterium]
MKRLKTIIIICLIIVGVVFAHAFLVYRSIAAQIEPLIDDQSLSLEDGLSVEEIATAKIVLVEINRQIEKLSYYRFLPVLRGLYLDTSNVFLALEKILDDEQSLEQELKQQNSEENMLASVLANADQGGIDSSITKISLLLSSLNSDFKILETSLANLSNQRILKFAQNDINDIHQKINQYYQQLGVAVDLMDVFPYFVGYPEPVTYLLLFQNNHEIRATGGFIGSYGLITIDRGQLVNLFIDDIYHLDSEVIGELEIEPPQPIRDYLGVKFWYMRDANWYPDFPTSAKKMMEFYGLENGTEKLDGVIAITPDVVSDLIALTGDLLLEDVLYQADDFTETLQYEVEQNYTNLGLSHWDRKDVIDRLARVILDEIFSMSPTEALAIVGILSDRLASKDILLYLKNQEAQQFVIDKQWDGSIQTTDKDYLMVVDSNMAALKTNQHIDRQLTYKVFQYNDALYGQLYINYQHDGDFAWDSTRYRTYTRVYVPQGAILVDQRGAMVDDRDPAIGSFDVYEENDKTVFGAFIAIEPGQTGRLELLYKLPENYQDYTLYYQRQPGLVDSLKMTYFDQILYSGNPITDLLID